MPKIVTDDTSAFLGLIGDLFPSLDVPRRRAPHFEQMVRQSTVELRLQPEESFILKVKGEFPCHAALGIFNAHNCSDVILSQNITLHIPLTLRCS